jgi:hypothetical protein
MLEERIERNIIVGGNDKIDLKNKLNVDECRIFNEKKQKFNNQILAELY